MSYEPMLRAVLLDVGGTLWPDRLTAHLAADPCLEQLARLLPGIDAAHPQHEEGGCPDDHD